MNSVPTRRVFRSGSIHAVRKQHDQTRLKSPLRLPVADKGIKDDLGAVEEVSELGLPDDEIVWTSHRHTILKGHYCFLREDTVGNLQVSLLVFEHGIEGDEDLVGGLIDQHGAPVRKGGTANVLSADPHIEALQNQTFKCIPVQ